MCSSTQHGVALGNIVVLAGFTFLGIMHREILMDMNDVDGDRAAGVLTLPVVFGAPLPSANLSSVVHYSVRYAGGKSADVQEQQPMT